MAVSKHPVVVEDDLDWAVLRNGVEVGTKHDRCTWRRRREPRNDVAAPATDGGRRVVLGDVGAQARELCSHKRRDRGLVARR